MTVPSHVSRSTMAAHGRGPVKVFVQPPEDSLEAMAMLFFSSGGPPRGLGFIHWTPPAVSRPRFTSAS